MKTNRRNFIFATAALLLAPALAGCQRRVPAALTTALEIDARTTCDLDGMPLVDYPGPKAQLFYAGQSTPVYFCDTVELFHTLLAPEQLRAVAAVFVQDMGKTDWEQPRGHWFDASTGFYVLGSRRQGSMGPSIASFSRQADADAFVTQWGGRRLRYAEIKRDMVDLSGGALHDSKM
ncbi:MAG: nitrous oxide reductase accessory protein NosL [Pseudomonadota bacterium]